MGSEFMPSYHSFRQMKAFLREMGQPVDKHILKSILFNEEEVLPTLDLKQMVDCVDVQVKRRLKKVSTPGGTPGGTPGYTPSRHPMDSTPSRTVGEDGSMTVTTLSTAQGQYIYRPATPSTSARGTTPVPMEAVVVAEERLVLTIPTKRLKSEA
jgi:hypothetical protein